MERFVILFEVRAAAVEGFWQGEEEESEDEGVRHWVYILFFFVIIF